MASHQHTGNLAEAAELADHLARSKQLLAERRHGCSSLRTHIKQLGNPQQTRPPHAMCSQAGVLTLMQHTAMPTGDTCYASPGAMQRVHASVLDLQTFKERDEHLSKSTARKLKGLISAAESEQSAQACSGIHAACCASPRPCTPVWCSAGMPQHASPSPSGGPTGRQLRQGLAPAAQTQLPLLPSGEATQTCSDARQQSTQLARSHANTGTLQCAFQQQRRAASQHQQQQTMVVDQVAQWRNRREGVSCAKAGHAQYRASRQVAFMLMLQRRSTGHRKATRYFDLNGKSEFELGQLHSDYRRGFAVAECPEAALERTLRPCLSDAGVVVVKGIANGLGYLQGGLMHVPTFRPICAMDLVISGTQQLAPSM